LHDPARILVEPISRDPRPATRDSGALVLIRLYVGLIFVGEGALKFLRPHALGPGRFIKAGIPAGELLAYLDGGLGIGCGLLILVGPLDARMNRAAAARTAPNPRHPRRAPAPRTAPASPPVTTVPI
jgi:hypothetical protein